MAAVSVKGVSKQFGAQIVLDDVSCELSSSETVGVVGANGSGKTTLFRIMAGHIVPDVGSVTTSRGLEVGYLPQEPEISLERTLHDEVGSAFKDLLALERRLHAVADQMAAAGDGPDLPEHMARYERLNARFIAAGGHTFETRLNEILGGLGFSQEDYVKPMAKLSGGQKCRAALAKLLLRDPEYLLLDEPTNHLDIDAVRWLEKFLTTHRGGVALISHDRYLLDRLCDRIIELDRARVASFPGNYSNYAQSKERRLLTEQRQYEKDTAFIKKERAFIAKHLAGQRTKEAQGRRKRLERRLGAGEFTTDAVRRNRAAKITFERVDDRQTGPTVLRCDELSMAFGENVLFTDLTFQVHAGDRLGITGPNGTGKTTLLRIILGELAAKSGDVILDPKLTVGYYGQEHVDLDPARTVVDEIRAVRSEFSELDARNYLARFLFTGDDVFKTLGMLSGGEQSRVRLASLILRSPDVLVLDEPTNHLDIRACESLEEALLSFGGTIIVVSHDRYFLDRVVDRLLVLRPEEQTVYAGNYSFYINVLEQRQAKARRDTRGTKEGAKRGGRKEGRPARKKGASPYDRLPIERLEELVMEREVSLAELQARFGDPALYKDPEALAELKEEIEAAEAALAEVDAAWQERVDQYEG